MSKKSKKSNALTSKAATKKATPSNHPLASRSTKNKMVDSMTVLVHGTFSDRAGFWYWPGLPNLHSFIRRYVFPDVYSGPDFFTWKANADDASRKQGRKDLLKWCEEHPAREYNFVAHSHGCSIVSQATHHGLTNVNKLVYLAPVVWLNKPKNIPNMDHVANGFIYNFHSHRDRIVTDFANPPGLQDFAGVIREYKQIIAAGGHFKPVRRHIWASNDLDWVIRGGVI